MGHVTEDVSRIAHDLVVSMSFDVTDEPYTTHAAAQEGLLGGKEELKVWGASQRLTKSVRGKDDHYLLVGTEVLYGPSRAVSMAKIVRGGGRPPAFGKVRSRVVLMDYL